MEDWGLGPGPRSGASGPCNRALAAASAGAVKGIKQAAEAAPKGVQGGQNRNGDAGRDQGVLDGCRTRLIPEEARKHGPHVDSPVLALLVFSWVRCLTCSGAPDPGRRAKPPR